MKRRKLFVIFILLCLINVIACSEQMKKEVKRELSIYVEGSQPDNFKRQEKVRQQEGLPRTFGVTHVDDMQHHNRTLSYRKDISKAIDQIESVAIAHVFTTDKNAYVGVLFYDSSLGPAKDADELRVNRNNPITAPNTVANSPFDPFFSVQNNSQIADGFKQRVSELIYKFVSPTDIEEVHISANREFMFYLNEYAVQAMANKDLTPWIADFNILTQYYFEQGQTMPSSIHRKIYHRY